MGSKIKSYRELKHYSQNDLASICNLEKTSISRIENGRTNITLKTLLIISDALETEIKDFFDFKE